MKTVLVTGCSRPQGFGQHIAKTLADSGYEVYATLRQRDRAKSLQEWAEQRGRRITVLEHDVCSPEQNQQVVAEVVGLAGRLDVLINNVGMSSFGALETLHDAHIREVLETNFFSAVDLTRKALARMREQGSGHVLFVSSMAGSTGIPGESVYCASKFALEGLAESLAMEVQRFGIDVSTIRPAFFNTGMSQDNTNAEHFFSRQTAYDEFNDRVVASTSNGELNGEDPQLVANTVLAALKAEVPDLRWYPGEAAPQVQSARESMNDMEWRTYVMSELGMSDWLNRETTGAVK